MGAVLLKRSVLSHLLSGFSGIGLPHTSVFRAQISDFVAGFVEHVQAMEVVTDSFGNYVAQRLIQASGAQARLAIGRLLAPAMLELSKHQYGCRVVQHAIQVHI